MCIRDSFWKKYEADLAECQETKVVHMGDADFFVEIYVKNPQLIIFGGGHVSQPVAKIGKMLGFHVTVMDDREAVSYTHLTDSMIVVCSVLCNS